MERFDQRKGNFIESGRPGRLNGRDFSPMDFPFSAFEFDEYDRVESGETPTLKMKSNWNFEAQKITEETIHKNIYITESYYDGTVQFDTDLRSEGYEAGVSGWKIEGDGDVEFASGTFRGTLSAPNGNIGGWTIGATSLASDNITLDSEGETITIGTDLTLDVTDGITALKGQIANFTIDTSAIYTGAFDTAETLYFGASGLSLSDTFKVTAAGALTATSGEVGGFVISSSTIADANNNVILNSSDARFEIKDAAATVKTALGYLGGIGTYEATQYGLYIAEGNTVRFEGGGDLVGNDYTIAEDGALVLDNGSGGEIGRFGSLGAGDIGFYIGNPDTGQGIRYSLNTDSLTLGDILLEHQIRSNYNVDGNIIDAGNAGFWLGANGKLKATNADLLGTLRTGTGAATDAKVAIADASGITSGPTFTGSGANDLVILAEGSVDGDFKVQISSKDNIADYSISLTGNDELNVESYGDDSVHTHKVKIVNTIVPYSVGNIGPAGGIIFYIDTSTSPYTYYEAWSADEGSDLQYKTSDTTGGGSGTDIGTGYANTYNDVGNDAEYPAFTACINATHGWADHSDWFLPSKEELREMYNQKDEIGGFASGFYWSSSEFDYDDAYTVNFSNGGMGWYNKEVNHLYVRAIRWFQAADTFRWTDDNWATQSAEMDCLTEPINLSHNVSISFDSFVGHSLNSEWVIDKAAIYSDGFKWNKDGGAFSAEYLIYNNPQLALSSNEITIAFNSATGHTVGDEWAFTQGAMRALSAKDSAGNEVFSIEAGYIKATLSELPTSDPEVSGALWRDGTTMKIST